VSKNSELFASLASAFKILIPPCVKEEEEEEEKNINYIT
jgi:hypothetical protein